MPGRTFSMFWLKCAPKRKLLMDRRYTVHTASYIPSSLPVKLLDSNLTYDKVFYMLKCIFLKVTNTISIINDRDRETPMSAVWILWPDNS